MLRQLEIPKPFHLGAFVERIAADRGRALYLVPLPGRDPGQPCGLWVATAEADWVFHASAATPLHREHIILHELAHMIAGHTAPASAVAQRLLPNLDPAMVASVLGRTAYDSAKEQEAETLATLILGRHARRQASVSIESADAVERAAAVLGSWR